MAPQHEDAAEADFNKTSSTNATTTAETGAAEETVNNNNNNNIKKNNGTKAVADPPGDHLATSSKDNDEDNDEDGVNVESNKPLVENEPNKQATMEEEATDAESKKPIQQPQTPKDSTATPSSIAAAAVVVAAGTLSSSAMAPVVLSSTSTKKSSNSSRPPPYKYNPEKITLRFLFCNRDGLTVTVECNPTDTVGEVKGALISVWPKGTSLLLLLLLLYERTFVVAVRTYLCKTVFVCERIYCTLVCFARRYLWESLFGVTAGGVKWKCVRLSNCARKKLNVSSCA